MSTGLGAGGLRADSAVIDDTATPHEVKMALHQLTEV
jgi:hypothetical protein